MFHAAILKPPFMEALLLALLSKAKEGTILYVVQYVVSGVYLTRKTEFSLSISKTPAKQEQGVGTPCSKKFGV